MVDEKEHTNIPESIPINSSHPDVEVLRIQKTPLGDHFGIALDNIYAGILKPCNSNVAHRLATSSILHFWFAMETSVNVTLHQMFNNKSAWFYKGSESRNEFDLMIAGKERYRTFEEKINYLKSGKDCCDTLENHIGKIRQFEKLRNALVHGYCYDEEMLLSAQGTPNHSENSSTQKYAVVDNIFYSGNKVIDIEKQFAEININNIMKLCSHKAAQCAYVSIVVMKWLDSHYGILCNSSFSYKTVRYMFYSRPNSTTAENKIIGYNDLMKHINATISSQDNIRNILVSKGQNGSNNRKKSKRRR